MEAEEFLRTTSVLDRANLNAKILTPTYETIVDQAVDRMKEFAKYHVEQALKAAAENAECCEGAIVDLGFEIISASVDRKSILDAYPLENIK